MILGANGAGKTTTLRALSGMIPRAGTFEFDGRVAARAEAGAGRASRYRARAAGPRHARRPHRRGEPAARRVHPASDREVGADIDRWYGVFPRLADRRDAGGGQHERRRAADARDRARADGPAEARVARRAVARPRADHHPGAVPHPRRAEPRHGLSMLVVEQNAGLALGIADRGYVLEAGAIAVSGAAAELAATTTSARRTWGSERGTLLLPGPERHRRTAPSTRRSRSRSCLIFKTTGILNFAQGEMALVLDVRHVVVHRPRRPGVARDPAVGRALVPRRRR